MGATMQECPSMIDDGVKMHKPFAKLALLMVITASAGALVLCLRQHHHHRQAAFQQA